MQLGYSACFSVSHVHTLSSHQSIKRWENLVVKHWERLMTLSFLRFHVHLIRNVWVTLWNEKYNENVWDKERRIEWEESLRGVEVGQEEWESGGWALAVLSVHIMSLQSSIARGGERDLLWQKGGNQKRWKIEDQMRELNLNIRINTFLSRL